MEQKIEKIIENLLENEFMRYGKFMFCSSVRRQNLEHGERMDLEVPLKIIDKRIRLKINKSENLILLDVDDIDKEDTDNYLANFLELDREDYFVEDLLEWIDIKFSEIC